jgi:glycosyltransferase involved in cell wall biosynthesis
MRIAYLAPEIPALSATFVYHEIIALGSMGFDVLPISVHLPAIPALEEEARILAEQTILLYPQGWRSFLTAAVLCKLRHPCRYLATIAMLLQDMWTLGCCNRAAAGLFYRFLAATRLARILEAHGCRHLHVHFAHVPTDIAMYAARLAGISFSFTSHANDLFERGWLLKEKVARSAQAMTISEYNRRFLVAQGADEGKIAIVRCGVSPGRFSGLREHTAPGALPVIGSLGRLVAKKGFDTLITAAGMLQRSGCRFRLEIAGDGPLREALAAQAEQEGAAGMITFLGPVANDRIPSWLAGLNQFVLACRVDAQGDMDGIPVALMEAMASGVPVISTTVSAVPELIEDGRSGLLVPSASPPALAEAIARLLNDTELRARCIAGGRQKIEGEFSEEANAKQLSQLFNAILTRETT